MKKLLLIACVSMGLSGYAIAGNEIQLAAAIGSGGASTPGGSTASTTTASTTTATTTGAGTAATLSTAGIVTVGVLTAGVVAALASDGSSSTSQH